MATKVRVLGTLLVFTIPGAVLSVATGVLLGSSTAIPDSWGSIYVDGSCPFSQRALECSRAAQDHTVALLPTDLVGPLDWEACAITRDRLIADGKWWLRFAPRTRWCSSLAQAARERHTAFAPKGTVPAFEKGSETRLGLAQGNFDFVGSACAL